MKKPKAKYPTVMLVDDNEIDNFINQKMIEASDFSEKIFTYTSGKSALEFLKNLEKNKELIEILVPDYIFLDINMPVMDGFQFLEEFRQLHEGIVGKCKIAILTTSMSPMDRDQAIKSELVSEFLSKPLTKDSLEKL